MTEPKMTESQWLLCDDVNLMLQHVAWRLYASYDARLDRACRTFACLCARNDIRSCLVDSQITLVENAIRQDDQDVRDGLLAGLHATEEASGERWLYAATAPCDALWAHVNGMLSAAGYEPYLFAVPIIDILRDTIVNPHATVKLPRSKHNKCPMCNGTGWSDGRVYFRATVDRDTQYVVTHYTSAATTASSASCACTCTSSKRSRRCDYVTDDAVMLAKAAFADHDQCGRVNNVTLQALADALEEAGCDNERLTAHLRSGSRHWCGCWALQLILGEENA